MKRNGTLNREGKDMKDSQARLIARTHARLALNRAHKALHDMGGCILLTDKEQITIGQAQTAIENAHRAGMDADKA